MLAMLFLSGIVACARNEAPQRRSNSRSSVDHLVIKEVFYIGHAYVQSFPKEYNLSPRPNWYSDEAYITIYNPSSEVKYLDGLALCSSALDPSVAVKFQGKEDYRKQYLGVSTISYFPGTGKQHPINPGQTIVIAKYAIDHAKDFFTRLDRDNGSPVDRSLYAGVDDFLDLSKVDWEWTNAEVDGEGKNNPSIPDLVPIYTGYDKEEKDDVDFGLKEITETSGIALIQLPWTPEDFAKNYPDTQDRRGYRHTVNTLSTHHHNAIKVIEIPFDKAIDCIIVCPKKEYKLNPYSTSDYKDTFDKGFTSVTDNFIKSTPTKDWEKYSGLAVIRKWDGKKVVDDNNSTSDFMVQPASLRFKKATPSSN